MQLGFSPWTRASRGITRILATSGFLSSGTLFLQVPKRPCLELQWGDLPFHTAKIFSRFCGLISGHFLNSKLFGYLKDLRDRMPAIFPWKSQGRAELCKLDPWLSIEESTLVFLGTLRVCLLAILTHNSQALVANHKKFCFSFTSQSRLGQRLFWMALLQEMAPLPGVTQESRLLYTVALQCWSPSLPRAAENDQDVSWGCPRRF